MPLVSPIKIFYNNIMEDFASKVQKYMGADYNFYGILEKRFANFEYDVQIPKNVRGARVVYMHGFRSPDEGVMELCLANDAFKRASAKEIINVLPFMPYLRQDRKDKPRKPISAKLVAKLIEVSGATRLITSDMHAGQIGGFYEIPVDNLSSTPLFAEEIKRRYKSEIIDNMVLVASDGGSDERTTQLSERMGGMQQAYINKKRIKANEVSKATLVGEVRGKYAMLVDDMFDTGGTMKKDTEELKKNGAIWVGAIGTHGVFSSKEGVRAQQKLSSLDEIIVTDTIPTVKPEGNISVITCANQYGEAIRRALKNESISELY